MRKMIVCYSLHGHTEKVARSLAAKINAIFLRIGPAREPKSQPARAMGAMLGLKPQILPCKTDLTDVDFLVLALPVWARRPPPFINRYIALLTGCEGKRFSVLVEMRSQGGEDVVRIVRAKLEHKGMIYVSSAFTFEKDVEAGHYEGVISRFAETIR